MTRAGATGAIVAAAVALAGGCGESVSAPSGSMTGRTDGTTAQDDRTEKIRLPTHCGVLSVQFAGRRWRADPPLSDGSGNPPEGWGNPFEDGTMTLISPDVAEYRGPAGHKARFVPLPKGQADPAEGCL